MSTSTQELLAHADDAARLEALFRHDPAGFREAFPALAAARADSALLRGWQARLDYDEAMTVVTGAPPLEAAPAPPVPAVAPVPAAKAPVLLVTVLALAAGALAKLPGIFPALDEEFFYPRNAGLCVAPVLALYFMLALPDRRRLGGLVLAAMAVAAMYMNLLPGNERDPGFVLAATHLPMLLVWMVALVFLGRGWREAEARAEYVRLAAETIVYTALILLAGILMTLLTLGLFSLLDLSIERFYTQVIVVMGLAAAPVVGTHLACQRLHAKTLVAPLLARLFSPLALLTLAAFLLGVCAAWEKLYADREFLLVLNLMSVCVLAIAALGLCGGHQRGWLDKVLFLLLVFALLIDLLALAGLLTRLSWFGFSVNRVAMLGANLVMTVHLGGLGWCLWRDLRGGGELGRARRWLLAYLPVYPVWTALVVFMLPFLSRSSA